MNRQQNYNSGLPPWAKGVIAVSVIAAVAFIGYKAYDFFANIKDGKDSKAVANDAKDAVYQLKKDGSKLSFPEVAYSSCITTIVKLLNGCDTFGSELQAVYEIAKVVKTPIDWYYLIEKFAKKDIDDCGWGKTNYDLVALVKDQLDTSGVYSIDINGYKKSGFAVNSVNILEDYLKSKGIQL